MSAHVMERLLDGRIACMAGDMKPGSIHAFNDHNRARRMREFLTASAHPCWICARDTDDGCYTTWAIRPGTVVRVCDDCAERAS